MTAAFVLGVDLPDEVRDIVPTLRAALPPEIAGAIGDTDIAGADLDNLDPGQIQTLVDAFNGYAPECGDHVLAWHLVDIADAIELCASPDKQDARRG